MRINQIQSVIFFLLGFIVLALIYMQIIRGSYYRDQSVNNRIRIVSTDGARGRILDRNGLVLADNHSAYNLGVVPQDVQDKNALFTYLGRILNKDPNFLYKQFKRKRLAPFAPVILAEDIDKDLVVKIEEDSFQYSGLVVVEGFERFYPYEKTGSHILGYVSRINEDEINDLEQYGYTPLSLIGKTGVEKMYDSVLHGEPGGKQIEVNSRGQQVRLLGLKDSVKGKDVVLTVDQRLQQSAQKLLGNSRGSIIVMDLSNGDILSMVSNPSFDPNAFTDRSKNELITQYLQDNASPLLNRSIAGLYPPGSVFKIPVALAAIQLNKITPDVTFDCPGYYMLGQRRFACAHVHGKQDMFQAIAHSCNVYFFHVGRIVSAPIIGAYAKAFGLGRLTGIDLPYELKGKVVDGARPGRPWFTGNTLNLSIGQGDTLATPLQMTVLMGAVANDGIILKPRIVKMVDNEMLPVEDLSHRPIVRLREDTWATVQKGLKLTVDDEEGTGHLLKEVLGMTVYGKTGTAQSVPNKPDHAWFVGYARSAKSNIAFCVFLEYGGSSANAVAISKDLLLDAQRLNMI